MACFLKNGEKFDHSDECSSASVKATPPKKPSVKEAIRHLKKNKPAVKTFECLELYDPFETAEKNLPITRKKTALMFDDCLGNDYVKNVCKSLKLNNLLNTCVQLNEKFPPLPTNGLEKLTLLLDNILNQEYQNGLAVFSDTVSSVSGFINEKNNMVTDVIKHALGSDVQKIMVIDLNGNGAIAENSLYDNKRLLYFSFSSLKSHEHSHLANEFNVTIPIGDQSSISDYFNAFDLIIKPVAYEFNPEMIFITFNYEDSKLKPPAVVYAFLIKQLNCFANGKVLCLYSGIQRNSISTYANEIINFSVHGLLDNDLKNIQDLLLTDVNCKTVRDLCIRFQSTWKCFRNFLACSSNKNEDNIFDQNISNATDLSYTDACDRNRGSTVHVIHNKNHMLHHSSSQNHVEKPDRLTFAFEKLEKHNLLKDCELILSEPMSESDILCIHTREYIDKLIDVTLGRKINDFQSVYLNENSLTVALAAVKGIAIGLEHLFEKRCSRVLALVRPPGHHADSNEASGFCLLNNVAYATYLAIEKYKYKKVLIIDFDIHFGNGTVKILEELNCDSEVLFISIHRYENGSFYPHDKNGSCHYTGSGQRKGYIVNIAWEKHEKKISDGDYIAAFSYVVLPLAREFAPDLVIISAGLDGAVGDPLGKCNVSPEMYGHILNMCKEISNGQLLVVLEGGYNVNSVAYGIALMLKSLLGHPLPPIKESNCSDSTLKTLNVVRKVHQGKWKSLW